MSTPKTPNSKPISFDVGHLVWAKVKGYPYWPGVVAKEPEEENAYGKRPKNGILVFFPDSNSSGWATPDNVKDYIEHRAAYVNAKTSAKYKKAVTQADERVANKGGPVFEPPVTPKTPIVKSEPSTPQTDKAVFKAKKAPASSTPSSVQRDYSRTPFKKEKRSFESTLSSADTPSSESRRKSASSDVPESKRPKVELQAQSAKKRVNSSPSKSAVDVKSDEEDDFNVSSSRAVEDKREKTKARTSKQPVKRSEVKYGFIGLGTIGQQVLKHMMTFGNPCTIWNRTPSKCKEFERLGATVVKTPGDVVRESDITFCCLSDADASSKIFYGNCGVVSEINPSKAYVELTSLDRSTSLDIEHGVKQHGGRYLEAPLICTSSKSVEEGKCTSVIAGDKSLFDECAPAFEKLCSHVFYVGEAIGQASQMNVIIASLNGNILGSLLESISIAERMGIDPKDIVDIIASSPVTNSIIQNKASALRDSTLLREIPIDHIRRDMTYALQIANLDGYSTPITAATNEMFKQKKHLYY